MFSRQMIIAATISTFTVFSGLSEDQSMEGLSVSTTEASTPDTSAYDYDYPDYDYGMCEYDKHGTYFLPALYSILFLLGFLGNSLVIWVITCGVRLRSMTDVCLLNLAIADLLLVCSLPFLAHQARDQWVFGDKMCKVVLGIYHIVFYCGIFFLCLISIDRYLAVVHAVHTMQARKRSFGVIAAAVTWVAGILALFPELIYLRQEATDDDYMDCYFVYEGPQNSTSSIHFWTIFSLFKMNILGLFIPIVIMTFCYSKIIWTLIHSRSSKKQAIRLVLIVVAVFFCCWVPYNVASLFKALEFMYPYNKCESSKALRLALQVTEAIAYSHSCLNPILYVFVGEKFRKHLVRLINRTPCGLCQAIRSVYSQTSSLDERSTTV